MEDTKCPKLDQVIKQNLSKEVKEADVVAAKLQTLMPDVVAPLVYILEKAQKDKLVVQVSGGSQVSPSAVGQCFSPHHKGEVKESGQRPQQRSITPGRGLRCLKRLPRYNLAPLSRRR